jgi:hemerythrin-like domain-containing protein
MQPRIMLMDEHRLIEYVIEAMVKESIKIKAEQQINPAVIDKIIDFIRVYADHTHHGKEENILFAELAKKQLDEHDSKLMQDLINEHVYARGVVKELVLAKDKCVQGEADKMKDVCEKMEILADFYPKHIKKEDEDFFLRTEKYFTPEELKIMSEKFTEFDAHLIHEKYHQVCQELNSGYC